MNRTTKRSLIEIFLLQLICWMALWLINDFLATILTLCIGAVVFSVLLVALLAEFVERSKVPRQYFLIMFASFFAILLAAMLYAVIFKGKYDFLIL